MKLFKFKRGCYRYFKKIALRVMMSIYFVFPIVNIAESNDNVSSDSLLKEVWGEAPPSALYLGMVTLHFISNSRKNDNWNNQLIGADYKGYFAGTLINSFGDRAYAVGVQRYIATDEISSNFNQSFGYRVGFISGYDKRMTPIAAETPVLLFPQLIYDISGTHLGLDISFSIVAVSCGLFYKF